jgi:hypothetical protein
VHLTRRIKASKKPIDQRKLSWKLDKIELTKETARRRYHTDGYSLAKPWE